MKNLGKEHRKCIFEIYALC